MRHPTCENDANGKLPSQPERLQVGSEGGTMPSPWQEFQKWMLDSIDGWGPSWRIAMRPRCWSAIFF